MVLSSSSVPGEFYKGVGVSVSLKGDIQLITDAFFFFPSIIGDAPLRWVTTQCFPIWSAIQNGFAGSVITIRITI